MESSKKILLSTIVIAVLIVIVTGVTFAFFNYTRTGASNSIKVGRIYFNTTQDNTINLTNVFPTDSSHLDSTNSATVTVNITGDTEYSEGIEYKVSLVDVQNTVNGKEVPISFSVEANDLGTQSNDYYNDRGSTTNVYNLVESGIAGNNQLILVGYIKPDNVGVNGSIDITAYLDKGEIGISDTVSRIENNNLIYGETDAEWIAGRTILTTTEWNGLQADGVSFKVKVEANEGIWINDSQNIVLKNINSIQEWKDIRNNITSVEFSSLGDVPNNVVTSFDATDLTSEGSVTIYILDDGLGNNTYKAIIVADDIIYAPDNSQGIFSNMPKLVEFNSDNFQVDNVTNMRAFFGNDSALENIQTLTYWNTKNATSMRQMFFNCANLSSINSLANWNVSNVQNMEQMFYNCTNISSMDDLINWNTSNVNLFGSLFSGCTSLTNVNGLANWNTSNVQYMQYMFNQCTSLTNVDGLKNWNTSNVQNMQYMFNQCTSLTNVDGLKNWNTSNVQYMQYMFNQCTSLTNVDGLKNWNTSNVQNMQYMFNQCTSLTNVDGLKNWNTSNVQNMQFMFSQCASLTNVNGLTNWNTSNVSDMIFMFQSCSSLINVDLSSWDMSNVVHDGCMFQSAGFKTLIMPNNYTRIDNFMFNHNYSFSGSSFTIPSTVTSIGNSHIFYQFGNANVFNKFIVESGSTSFKTIDDILYTYDGTRLISIPKGKTFANRTYEMPEGVTFMNELSFSSNGNIDTLILPNSYVVERYIDKNNNNYGFINSGNSLSVAIYRNTSIKRYEVKNDNPYYSSDSGCIYSKDGSELIAVPFKYEGILNIKSGTTTIGQEAFWDFENKRNDALTAINIPASVTTIEANQLVTLNKLMSASTNPVTITIDSGNTSYQIVNNQIVAR